jgi:hypothetical protein
MQYVKDINDLSVGGLYMWVNLDGIFKQTRLVYIENIYENNIVEVKYLCCRSSRNDWDENSFKFNFNCENTFIKIGEVT